MQQSPTTTSEAFYIVIGAIIAFIIALAALLTAIGVIWAKLVKPIRDRVDLKLFKPLETAVKEISDISTTLHGFEARLQTIERKFETTDISLLAEQLKKIEETVTINRYSLRHMFERDSRAIFMLNEKGECIFVNTALCELLDVDSTDLEYRNWIQKIHHNERAKVNQLWQVAYQNKAPFDNVQTVLVGNSTLHGIKMRVFAKPIIFDDKVVRFVGGVELVADN